MCSAILAKILSRISITFGISSSIICSAANAVSFNAKINSGAALAISLITSTIPSPTLITICGMRLRIDSTASTNTAIPAVPVTANAASAVENNNKPAAQANTPIPRSVTAAANPNIAGITGDSKAAAPPITKNIPANARRALPISVNFIPPNVLRTGTNIANEAAITSIATEPLVVPLIAFNANVIISKEPAKVTSPFPISSQPMLPMFVTALPIISNAAPTNTSPVAITAVDLGKSLIAAMTRTSEPAIVASPFPICSQLILPMFSTAFENISIAAPRITIPAAVDMTCFESPVSFTNTPKATRTPATASNPLIRTVVSNSPNAFTDFPNTFIASANNNIPTPLPMLIPSRSAVLKNTANEVTNPSTPNRPLDNCSMSSSPSSFTGFTSNLIAMAKAINPAVPLITCFSFLDSESATFTKIYDKPAIAAPPFMISS